MQQIQLVNVINPKISPIWFYLKFTLCGEATCIVERTKKTPSGGKVMTLLRRLRSTSMTCKTSPARVPNTGAFWMMNSCSFSVVHRSLHVAEREVPVVTLPLPSSAKASMALMIEARLVGSFWVLRPRSWSAMRSRRCCLARRDWAVTEEQVILARREEWKGMVRKGRHVAMWMVRSEEAESLRGRVMVLKALRFQVHGCGW